MKNKKFLAMLLSLVMIMSVLSGCSGATTGGSVADSVTDPANRPVVVYVADIFNTLNPFDTGAFSDSYVFNQVYETLAKVDDQGNPQPYLAESWEISDDALTYTLQLVKDAKFQNGETLKASDVVFTYEYAKQFAAKNAYYAMVKSVEALDDYTVKITLDKPTPLFLSHTQQLPIVNEKFVKENNNDISKVACGTGAYTIVSYDPAVKVMLTRNDDYRLGAASIKDVELRYVSDASSAVVSLESGEINFMSVPPVMATTLEDNANFTSQKTLPLYTAVIAMNTKVKPFDNKVIRQAFSYACDKQSIIDIAYEGFGTVARLQAYTNSFGVDFTGAPDFSYNPEKAKELLAQAGYPDGLNLTKEFGIKLLTIPGTFHEKVGQVFQKNLADIGVVVELQNTQTPDEDVESGNFAIMNQGATYRSDFSYNECNYGVIGIGGNNYSQMNEPYVDEMFAKGAAETDPEARKAIYKELINFLIDYCPGIPVFHKQEIYFWSSGLNASAHDSGMFPFFVYEWSWK
ncbi:MAG: ABC transporter substrate-binding protein [Sedimentibacter sp.]|uniref:ABC transporter substrate-binding protein n=1 Tax=Sedimentibacter sp. TaxID=1960295 RepID=UPI002980A65C|nr:ABC transporter substrate-binding protein [Sedimentibacter sp.]MDW5299569.1 ABC transporter substrate-binding protein [Sedimentibacter sp.]